MNQRSLLNTMLLAMLVFFSSLLRADELTVGEYTVHYNLLNSSFIEPKIATQLGIKRSKNLGLLNITVRKNSDEKRSTTVISNIFGHGASLAGQVKELSFKEIKEAHAIYYIATFSIINSERLTFDLQVQPEKKGKLIAIEFEKRIYIN